MERGITTATETTARAEVRNREKVAHIIARHGTRVAQLTSWYLDARDVDDVLQDIWTSVYRNLWQLEDESRLLPWLKAITFHACLDHRKTRKRRAKRESLIPPEGWSAIESFVADNSSSLDEMLETRELQETISAVLDGLPGSYGMLLRLRYMKDLSYEEIADATGMPVSLVKQRLHQGRDILRSRLARSLDEIGINRRRPTMKSHKED